ncbi:ribosome hibernation-promoting factor, HPF/YfiA family [Marinobacterium arenosum]|uniref:ribosome hibernation-promoting factor, HPF/YfiA family n=1 Tax=Marinobacterium arenosum TaxID=2862496 RepID=UPI001C9804A1|nr:ribosome-associated translation inhibitor RaiA [Marinobacterium arenosum]MBY4676452.1 ribosome-associated translation inhibitor RaiA [Marinobacterium arenosum]
MIINITNRNDKVSPAVREKIEAWLGQSQKRFDMITSAQITLAKVDQQDEAEATLHVAGKDLFAKAVGDNLYAALDSLSDKVDKQLLKIRKKQTHKKGTPKPQEIESAVELDDLDEE